MSSDRVPELRVVEFPTTSLQDIPNQFRDIARRLETGNIPEATAVVVILYIDEEQDVRVHGFAEATAVFGYWMLGRAMRKLDSDDVVGR
jgi:hypothetical protein